MAKRWKKRPEGSNWGEFGDDDQLGSLNYITSEAVLRAVKEVLEGRSFCLSLPLDYPGGRSLAPIRFPPTLKPTERDGNPVFNSRVRTKTHYFCDVVCDDAVLMCTQYSTQWDSFAHVGSTFDLDGTGEEVPCFYNGYRAGTDVIPPDQRGDDYAMTLGIDKFAVKAIQSRGVLVDLEKHFGRAEKTVTFTEFENVMKADGVTVQPGDMVCIHTAFGDEVLKMGRDPDPERIHQHVHRAEGQRRGAAQLAVRKQGRSSLRGQFRRGADGGLARVACHPPPAAASALPVQARHPARRALVLYGACDALAAGETQPLHADGAAACA